MASVLCARLVCFSGCWGLACVLLSICRKLPPCVYTTGLFVVHGKVRCYLLFCVHRILVLHQTQSVHQDGSSTAR